MDTTVEVRYAGVVVGRGALVKDLGADGAFVGLPEPLPVGTLVTLKIGEVVHEARVDDVVESADPSAAGMRVRWGGGAAAPELVPVAAPVPVPVPVAVAVTGLMAPAESGPLVSAESSPMTLALEGDGGSAASGDGANGALPAPLSLASPAGEGQQGGGKRRRKRR